MDFAQHPKNLEWIELLAKNQNLIVEELWDSAKAYLISTAHKKLQKPLYILTSSPLEEGRLFQDLAYFTDAPLFDFPAWETLPSEGTAPSPDVVGDRYRVLRELLNSSTPPIVVGTLHASLQKLLPPSQLSTLHLLLTSGEERSFDELIDRLVAMGYIRSTVAADKGEFAVRGGLIDLYPVNSTDPVRAEFFGDELESLRIYDPISQRSIRPIQQLAVEPAQELELIQKSDQLATVLDYLGEETLIIYDNVVAIEDRFASLVGAMGQETKYFCALSDFVSLASQHQTIFFSEHSIETLSANKQPPKAHYYSSSAPSHEVKVDLFMRPQSLMRFVAPFVTTAEYLLGGGEKDYTGEQLLDALERPAHPLNKITCLTETELEQQALQKRLAAMQISQEVVNHQKGYLSQGLGITDEKQLLLPYAEITGRAKIRRQKQRSTYHTTPAEVWDLESGNHVVHLGHGIGEFVGLETRSDAQKVEREFFRLRYAEGAELFVPIDQAHLLTKYVGTDESSPHLHKIGSNRWRKARAQTERAIMGYARELLELYAAREVKTCFKMQPHSDDLKLFEDAFPFIETEDQIAAIHDIFHDFSSGKAMDRLVCGDVGYGKTEVAMRAAFKTVVDGGKQVAMLAPTGVLALQHYENFCERFADFPIQIAVLSRFRKPKERQAVLEGIANGSIDIVVGTHRLISRDVQFKDLGLLIIDEEQRFGVRAKEFLKKLRHNVHSLTMSATPIPRTLHMSLVGVRPMSVIATPPQDRLPIKTVVAKRNDQLIQSALLRELSRDGQAYFVHNRVETIEDQAMALRKMLPNARIAVVHGQMNADSIDATFHAFKSAQIDILVATSIIENGIDIPNANTLIVDRADRFGLADLYQLRGRVGRWNRRAFAYFLVPNTPNELVQKRLEALAGASGYGGGMKLAMRDLEIRGAGNILGTEQSGHVTQVGFHLYCKLLKRTVAALQGEMPSSTIDCRVETPFDARLQEHYVESPALRMEIYQRLGESIHQEEVDAIWSEIKDRYGAPPHEAMWLYHMTRLRVFAARQGFLIVKIGNGFITTERMVGSKKIEEQAPCKPIKKPAELETHTIPCLKRIIKK